MHSQERCGESSRDGNSRRILVVAPFGQGLLGTSYAAAFEALGHEVVRFDSDAAYYRALPSAGNRIVRRMLLPMVWRRLNREVLHTVDQVEPDVVVVFKGMFLNRGTIEGIKAVVPIVNYYPDNPYLGFSWNPHRSSVQRRDLLNCLRGYTTVFIWVQQLVDRLIGDRVAARYLPFGVDSVTLRVGRLEGDPITTPVAYVGGHSPQRERDVGAIMRHQATIWGPGWGRASRAIFSRHQVRADRMFGDAMMAVYAATPVSLNVLRDLNMPGHNMRTFEIPAAGGVMLSTYTPEQAEFFPEGEAAWYYRSTDELDDVLDRVLRDPSGLQRVRRRALKLSARHDYRYRAEALITSVLQGGG